MAHAARSALVRASAASDSSPRGAHPFSVSTTAGTDDPKLSAALDKVYEKTLRTDPGCIYEEATVIEAGAELVAHAVLEDGHPTVVQPYPTYVTNADFLACLEGQLDAALASVRFGNVTTTVETKLVITIVPRPIPGAPPFKAVPAVFRAR